MASDEHEKQAAEVMAMIADAINAAGEPGREALKIISNYGGNDGSHHKQWVLDQVVRELAGDEYADWVRRHCAGADGPNTYEWDEGVPP